MLKRVLVCIGFILVAGCGGGDDEGESDSSDDEESGTCDASTSDGVCTEVASARIIVDSERESCVDSGGTWTNDRCPTGPTLVGCCYSTLGGKWLDCTYTNGGTNPQDVCAAVEGDWRPGSR